MKHAYRSRAPLVTALLCVAASSFAQTTPRVEDLRRLEGWSAAEIIGARVRSADGTDVGEIEDLVFSSDARVVTAVVSVGGLLDIADRLVAIPYDALHVASDDETLALRLTAAEIEAAPSYKAEPPAVGDPQPIIDPARTAPPGESIRREAEAEAARTVSGDDPRVAEGIAENKKAYENEEAAKPQQ